MFYKKIPIYTISYENAVIPWERYKYNIYNVKGINFLAMIKPWVLLPMLQWGEQNIWHKIAKKALDKDSIITELYVSNLLRELKKLGLEVDTVMETVDHLEWIPKQQALLDILIHDTIAIDSTIKYNQCKHNQNMLTQWKQAYQKSTFFDDIFEEIQHA